MKNKFTKIQLEQRIVELTRITNLQFEYIQKQTEIIILAFQYSKFQISGPTDHRAAEDGEPIWVCRARELLAQTQFRRK